MQDAAAQLNRTALDRSTAAEPVRGRGANMQYQGPAEPGAREWGKQGHIWELRGHGHSGGGVGVITIIIPTVHHFREGGGA